MRLATDEGTMGDPGHQSLLPDTRHITMIDGREEKLTPRDSRLESHNEMDTGKTSSHKTGLV